MKKIRAAVVGYGNIGKFTLEALEAAPDFEVAGIVRRNGAENKPAELADYPVVKDIRELKDVDVAILATPTRSVEQYAKEILALGINTVDSFDIHTQITSLRRSLGETAKAHNAVAIISAGWDPGSDSVVRSERNHLHELRSGPQHGPLCSRSRHCRSKRCVVYDYSGGNRYSPPYGICRTGRRCRFQDSRSSHQS